VDKRIGSKYPSSILKQQEKTFPFEKSKNDIEFAKHHSAELLLPNV
jgi:hypothetical protein